MHADLNHDLRIESSTSLRKGGISGNYLALKACIQQVREMCNPRAATQGETTGRSLEFVFPLQSILYFK